MKDVVDNIYLNFILKNQQVAARLDFTIILQSIVYLRWPI